MTDDMLMGSDEQVRVRGVPKVEKRVFDDGAVEGFRVS